TNHSFGVRAGGAAGGLKAELQTKSLQANRRSWSKAQKHRGIPDYLRPLARCGRRPSAVCCPLDREPSRFAARRQANTPGIFRAPRPCHVVRTRSLCCPRGARLFVSVAILISHSLLAQSPRLEVIHAMLQRPNDPWPRGKGHVVLAVPGCLEANKGYHEPGGSFSPSFGSFGVSIWVTDSGGKIVATSDSLPFDEIQQQP